ncbi:hypothetical protein M427DRAFT_158292 [Gonapodya prolifera JEL478]|uniref:Uncharacterized protein n=1 Tax=Gonapodya prolifera (strain JEL478) TaxID=1344416 RepID=A0A139A346_GONPJ|nr:hypothetical protein M427DRAFT_158292 [Gonapodya prolifera JEL478]|eukprot:KXS11236.1 hypothetical protein M427DRAFT_158292 [Gonapodya prolifera JEL478]
MSDSTQPPSALALYIDTLSPAGAAFSAALYLVAGGWFLFRCFRGTNRELVRVTGPLTAFCFLRSAALISRSLLPIYPFSSSLAISEGLILLGTPALLLGICETGLMFANRADEATLAFLGRDALRWSNLFHVVSGYYHAFTIFVLSLITVYGPSCSFIVLLPSIKKDFKAAWKLPQYTFIEVASVVGAVCMVTIGIWRFRTAKESPAKREVELNYRSGDESSGGTSELSRSRPAVALGQGGRFGSSSEVLSVGSRGEAGGRQWRIESFLAKKKVLMNAAFRLLLPVLILILIRIGYAPFLISDENFMVDPRHLEPRWFLGVVLLELVILLIFAPPDQLLFLDVPAVRMRPGRERGAEQSR